jgi:death-on-curing protein
VKRLDADQVIRLHERVIERFWGDPGLRDRGLLESALARPFATFGGVEAHLSVPEKAAALWHALVVNHPFVDANRPTALAATLVFLHVNSYRWMLGDDELVALSKRVVEERWSAAELAVELANAVVTEHLE